MRYRINDDTDFFFRFADVQYQVNLKLVNRMEKATILAHDADNDNYLSPAISRLKFPFELEKDQKAAVDAWLLNDLRGSIIYSSGTGKTEIALECARRAAEKVKNQYRILFLVPRIVLISQNYARLIRYGISADNVGMYYGAEKQIREITLSTYQSAVNNLDLVRDSDMVVFDEVHLVSDTARVFSKLFDTVVQVSTMAMLGLTATIDPLDPRYNTITAVLPCVKKYSISEAVLDGRLAKPLIIPIEVQLTDKEQALYDQYTTKIRNISNRFKSYDAKAMTMMLKKGGVASGMAKAWFSNVRKRKNLLACSDRKLIAVAQIIKKYSFQRIMVFSETIESLQKLKSVLESEGISCVIIDSKTKLDRRNHVLSLWGNRFFPLLSVHTLEIGYDVPEVAIEIILATSSNMNQIIQRVGRVVRKCEGKDTALIYVVYVSDSKDIDILAAIKNAVGENLVAPCQVRQV